MNDIKIEIKELAKRYADLLKKKIDDRVEEMNSDDKSHYLIYEVLGITSSEGDLIDVYQNKGRFLYKYAGSFLEEAATKCFIHKFPEAEVKVKIPNNIGRRPKTFEIDCLVGDHAYEIKWRDATTDGDHITKEHTRAQNIKNEGYIPVRIMFYYPNRTQAMRIQETIKTVYQGLGGSYYFGDDAWDYIAKNTGIDLKEILTEIANENTKK